MPRMTEQPTTSLSRVRQYGRAPRRPPRRAPRPPTRRPLAWNGGTDIGLLLLRFGIGGAVFAHGAQKVFGLWGGPGIAGFTATSPPSATSRRARCRGSPGSPSWSRAPFVLGLLTPLAAAGLSTMINAVLLKLGNGFFVTGPSASDASSTRVVLGLGAASGVHRAGPDRAGQRPRLAPTPGVVGGAGAGHRRRRRRAGVHPAAPPVA